MGSKEEAVICVDELGDAWNATPGALEWLATHAPAGKRRKRHPALIGRRSRSERTPSIGIARTGAVRDRSAPRVLRMHVRIGEDPVVSGD
jgi:hypothetical protein